MTSIRRTYRFALQFYLWALTGLGKLFTDSCIDKVLSIAWAFATFHVYRKLPEGFCAPIALEEGNGYEYSHHAYAYACADRPTTPARRLFRDPFLFSQVPLVVTFPCFLLIDKPPCPAPKDRRNRSTPVSAPQRAGGAFLVRRTLET